ncbi:serine protease inhibitor ecotin [Aquirhabdus sp.]|uniref:serine protease inhibitor ecotin n=1 Tax=Aquirhabdus sp. TaxID=2824160 RepID=UPI00396CEDC5
MKSLAVVLLSILSTACAVHATSAQPQDATTINTSSINPESLKNLAPFPKAQEGFQRYVIHVPATGNDDNYQVELIAGKTAKVDCNRHGLNGNIAEKDLSGWGYTYYEFTTQGQMVSTMMACPHQPETEKFVTGATKLVRYNSRLPIVVFVPNGYELKYRLWKAQDTVAAPVN